MRASDLFIRCLERDGCECIFGVPGAPSDAPRSATVRATTDAVVSVLHAGDFRSLLAARPEIALALARLPSERLGKGH